MLHIPEQLLGQKGITNTLLHAQPASFQSDEFPVKTARTPKETDELAKVGFDYFTVMDNVQIFLKRK